MSIIVAGAVAPVALAAAASNAGVGSGTFAVVIVTHLLPGPSQTPGSRETNNAYYLASAGRSFSPSAATKLIWSIFRCASSPRRWR